MYIALVFNALFMRRHHFIDNLGERGGTILLVILERRLHFIDDLSEEAPVYWINLGEGWSSFFIFIQNCARGLMVHALPGRLVI